MGRIKDWWIRTNGPSGAFPLESKGAIPATLPLNLGIHNSSGVRWSWGNKQWRMDKASTEAYEAAAVVRSCVDIIARPLRSVPFRVSKFMQDPAEKARFLWELKTIPAHERSEFLNYKSGGARWNTKSHLVPQINHPLETLMNEPNPYFSGHDYIEMSVQHLLLGGNALFVQARNSEIGGNRTVHLWLVPPDEISPVKDGNRWISRYQINDRSKSKAPVEDIPAEDVIHLMLPNPTDAYWGLSPLKSAAMAVDTDLEAVTWNKYALQNRAQSSGVFTFEGITNREQWEEARQMVEENHMGAGNAWVPWVLGNNARWQEMSHTPVEMDWVRGRGMNREDIAMAFGINPKILGATTQQTNRDDYRELMRQHWLGLLMPLLDRYEDAFSRVLLKEYPQDDLFIWYDTSNVDALREADIDKARVAKIHQSMGVPINMINERLRLGYPPIPGGDVGFLPASAITVERAILGDTKPAQGEGTGNQLDTNPEGGENVTEVIDATDEPASTGVSAQVGEEGMKMLPGSGRVSLNGHAKMWTKDELTRHLEDQLMLDDYEIEDDGNHYMVKSVEMWGEQVPRFYHGGLDLMLATKRKEWGWER